MLKLVPADYQYAADLFEAVHESRDDLEPWLAWAKSTYSMDDVNHWLGHIAPQGYEFFVLDAAGRYVGSVGLNALRPANRIANLGYWIRSSAKGRGLATAAVTALVAWARSNTYFNRLEVVVAVGNTASRRVAEKAGAHYEGVAKARLLLKGQYHDAAMYSFTNGADVA